MFLSKEHDPRFEISLNPKHFSICTCVSIHVSGYRTSSARCWSRKPSIPYYWGHEYEYEYFCGILLCREGGRLELFPSFLTIELYRIIWDLNSLSSLNGFNGMRLEYSLFYISIKNQICFGLYKIKTNNWEFSQWRCSLI